MYTENASLPDIICTLSHAGFDKADICMVLSSTHPMASVVRDARFTGAEPKQNAAGARTIGWFTQFGAVVIPDVGFFVRSQAYLHALLEQGSSPLCGESRILVGLGLSAEEAKRVHSSMADAGALLFVSCSERARAEWAVELLRSTGARDAASVGTSEKENAGFGDTLTVPGQNGERALAAATI
jgi:hypothetical protein